MTFLKGTQKTITFIDKQAQKRYKCRLITAKRARLKMVGIAQLVEQGTENPRVTSSNLVPDDSFL
ncbi:hypothetical protein MTR_8g463390 [Medicago truncatula]|uniref:Uncharacterized protein n=1 Tax=Medicago truncatula TaxID=3880 RepID=A0A072TPU6_MEDTR|nr:hypothetical protein MTR_8g463390 [Medicago truncatula]